MKKYLFVLCISVACLICMIGCSKESNIAENNVLSETEEKWDLIPMVMINGELYLDTGYTNTDIRKCGTPDGEITSSVEGWEEPTKDDQSNFGTGYGYQYGSTEGTVEIFMNDEWRVFALEANDDLPDVEAAPNWGITLTTKNITPTSVVIKCTQEGGEPTGELLTGSYFILEIFNDGIWQEADCFAEVAWTSEAWMIPMNATVEWEVNWEFLYGELSEGQYRIGKQIMDFRDTGDYVTFMHYAEFEITE